MTKQTTGRFFFWFYFFALMLGVLFFPTQYIQASQLLVTNHLENCWTPTVEFPLGDTTAPAVAPKWPFDSLRFSLLNTGRRADSGRASGWCARDSVASHSIDPKSKPCALCSSLLSLHRSFSFFPTPLLCHFSPLATLQTHR